jgi:hypothetical protein
VELGDRSCREGVEEGEVRNLMVVVAGEVVHCWKMLGEAVVVGHSSLTTEVVAAEGE